MENQQVPDSSLDAKSVPAFVGGNPTQINDELLFEQLLRVLDEGQRTGTYKLALLTALINAASLSPEEPTLSTRIIAELLLELYFPQFLVRTYLSAVPQSVEFLKRSSGPTPGRHRRDPLRLNLSTGPGY